MSPTFLVSLTEEKLQSLYSLPTSLSAQPPLMAGHGDSPTLASTSREETGGLFWREGSQFFFTLEQLTHFSFLPVGPVLKRGTLGATQTASVVTPTSPRTPGVKPPKATPRGPCRPTPSAGGQSKLTFLKRSPLPRKPQGRLGASNTRMFSHLQGISH